MEPNRDHLSNAEIGKDAIQAGAEAAASTVAEVSSIVIHAVRDVATSVGGLATELFEIGEASRRAADEHSVPAE